MVRAMWVGVGAAAVLLATTGVSLCYAETAPGSAGAQAEGLSAAIEKLETDVAGRPDDVELRVELGNLYYESGLLDHALQAYLAAIEVDSLHVGAHLNLGAVYVDKGNSGAAIEVLEVARALDPANPMVYTNLGSTYYWLQKYTEAVDMYLTALALDPNYVEAHFNLAVAFADAQIFDEAIREWRTVIELAPESQAATTSTENIRMIEEFRGAGR